MKIILILISFSFCLLGQTHYVSKEGSAIPPYSSWATAADSIYKAIEIAQDGDTIMIANGWYHESFEIDKELVIIGQSKENTVISGRGLDERTIVLNKSCHLRNLRIYGRELLDDNHVAAIYSLHN